MQRPRPSAPGFMLPLLGCLGGGCGIVGGLASGRWLVGFWGDFVLARSDGPVAGLAPFAVRPGCIAGTVIA